jgi:hypothetical protein
MGAIGDGGVSGGIGAIVDNGGSGESSGSVAPAIAEIAVL